MTTPKINDIKGLLEISKNSSIASIIQKLMDQDFAPINDSPVIETDVKLGTLTLVEKAIFSVHADLATKGRDFMASFKTIMDEDPGEDASAHMDKIIKLRKEISLTKENSRNLSALFWAVIRQRLHSEGISNTERLAIRSDCSIVIPAESTESRHAGTLVIKIGI